MGPIKVYVTTKDGKPVCGLFATSIRQTESHLEIVYDGGPMHFMGKDMFCHPGEYEKWVSEYGDDTTEQ